MAGERPARPLTVVEAKARLLAEEPATGLVDLNGLIRRHPATSMVVTAVAGVVLMRSATVRSLLVPAAMALVRQSLR